ncbi:DUF4345 family protein [Litorimonas sp. RW-G-Af-16]|uniref:DUF4345 family protein n=1 Tax=Litorimonas sp. RW-G-Af-16 TaxID=3241168 RepID=UPI003AABC0BA
MKIFNYINGIFYVLYGLFGAALPRSMADIMGWDLSLLGLHQTRAISCAMAALGAILLLVISQGRDQKLITMMIIFVTLSFAAGRCIGILVDGAEPSQTVYEIIFEICLAALGAGLIWWSDRKTA